MLNHRNISFVFIALIFGTVLLNLTEQGSLWLLPIEVFLWGIFTGWGSFDIRLNYFLKSYSTAVNSTDKRIAITFDDGPHQYSNEVLDVLKHYNVKATFFCIGKQIEKYPDIFKRIIKEGHVVGNHTYTHFNSIGFSSTQKVEYEIDKTDEIIQSHINKKPKLFRPPFGVTNPRIARVIQKTKHHVIGWNVRSLDTVIKGSSAIYNRVYKKIKPGCIVLLHDTSPQTVVALEQLLLFLKEQQYQPTTVDQLLNIKAYEN